MEGRIRRLVRLRASDCTTIETHRRAANTSAWLIPWNLTGQPALTIPTGVDDDNLPAAIQLVGKPGDEATLLGLAAQIEAAQPVSRYPNRM